MTDDDKDIIPEALGPILSDAHRRGEGPDAILPGELEPDPHLPHDAEDRPAPDPKRPSDPPF
jgi:hypothetical protein